MFLCLQRASQGARESAREPQRARGPSASGASRIQCRSKQFLIFGSRTFSRVRKHFSSWVQPLRSCVFDPSELGSCHFSLSPLPIFSLQPSNFFLVLQCEHIQVSCHKVRSSRPVLVDYRCWSETTKSSQSAKYSSVIDYCEKALGRQWATDSGRGSEAPPERQLCQQASATTTEDVAPVEIPNETMLETILAYDGVLRVRSL